ncbi:MAG: preprotein translocase subunit SecG [Gammaproteobacteria bacterium]
MLLILLTAFQFVLAILLLVIILLQHGKGADAGAGFGAGASGTVFGARGAANFLSRTTAVAAVLFFANCIALTYVTQTGSGSSAGLVLSAKAHHPTRAPQKTKPLPAPVKKSQPLPVPGGKG